MDELEPAIKIGIAANLAKHYAAQGRDLLSPLSRLLGDALGERVEIKMAGGFLSKKHLVGLAFTLGEWRYSLEGIGGVLTGKRTRVVRGIALKTEEVAVAQWLEKVGLALEVEARSNQATHDALSKYVWWFPMSLFDLFKPHDSEADARRAAFLERQAQSVRELQAGGLPLDARERLSHQRAKRNTPEHLWTSDLSVSELLLTQHAG